MPASRLSRGGGVGVVTSALAPPTPIKNALSPVTLQPYLPRHPSTVLCYDPPHSRYGHRRMGAGGGGLLPFNRRATLTLCDNKV